MPVSSGFPTWVSKMTSRTTPVADQVVTDEKRVHAEKLLRCLCALVFEAKLHSGHCESMGGITRAAKAATDGLLEKTTTARLDFIGDHVFLDDLHVDPGRIDPEALDYTVSQIKNVGVRAVILDGSAEPDDIAGLCIALAGIKQTCPKPFEEVLCSMKFEGVSGIELVGRKAGLDAFYRDSLLLLSDEDRAKHAFFTGLQVIGEVVRDGMTFESVKPLVVRRAAQALLRQVIDNRPCMLGLTRTGCVEDYIGFHSVSVCILAVALAEDLGLPLQTIRGTAIAALMHDVGRRFVPGRVKKKIRNLTDYDVAKISNHTWLGLKVFTTLQKPERDFLQAMAATFCHHMNVDRSGYPRTRKRIRPNVVSRIVRIADVYDSLTRTRTSEMKTFSKDEALAMIGERAGTELDPLLCAVFRDLMREVPEVPPDLTELPPGRS
jgi:HD-GYP domain-containing protein (c-di-GMP phosphodiesterase class II)